MPQCIWAEMTRCCMPVSMVYAVFFSAWRGAASAQAGSSNNEPGRQMASGPLCPQAHRRLGALQNQPCLVVRAMGPFAWRVSVGFWLEGTFHLVA